MNAIVSWATTVTSPLTALKSKRVGLFLLAMVVIGLAAAGYMRFAKPAASPTLMAERVEINTPLAHSPEPVTDQGLIEHRQPLPITTAIQIPTPAATDPLILEHTKKLADLDTVVAHVKGDIAGMASRLDAFQTELHGIKQQLAQRPVFAQATHARQHGSADAGKVRLHRQRARVNSQPVSSPKTFSAPGLQLVAVNQWGPESRLIVRQQGASQYRQLRIGDTLAGGTIVGMNAHQITIKNANGIATVDLGKGRL